MEKSNRQFSFTPVRAAKIPANISPQRGRSLPLTEGCRKEAMKLKDLPREKPFLQECVQQLHEFLAENRYAEYRPMLQAPSTGDSHLLSLIDTLLLPGFGMPSTRLQDEICGIFTGLGFPFALLKSSFYAVEAISRPQFDTMVWLIGVLKMFLNIQKDCGHILSGKNDMQQYGRELEMLLIESLYNGNPAPPPAARAGHRAFSRKMADVQCDQAQELVFLTSMRKLKNSLKTDLKKHQISLTNIESRLAGLERRAEDVTRDLEIANLELEALKQGNATLKNIVDHQPHSHIDIDGVEYEKWELQQVLDRLGEDQEKSHAHLWNEELQYPKNQVEVQLTEHHKLTRRPGPAPFSAEGAARQDFQIRRNLHGAQTCMIQCQAQIDALVHQVNQQIDQMESEIISTTNQKTVLGHKMEENRVEEFSAKQAEDFEALTEENFLEDLQELLRSMK
ncbi:kinetochore protein NDC80 homolog isoform X2 [Ascaphus truei]|uniref:kinetochore protein NDC80 homolog isoform X2 n=1 Tax=Ascaphus truei TaxID=8439 RepID=UPI003F591D5F